MNKIEAWGCEWCNMVSRFPGSVKRHERHYCRKNPNRVACSNCSNCTIGETTVYNPMHGGNPGTTDYEIKEAWCDVTEDTVDWSDFYPNRQCETFSPGAPNKE